MKWLVVIRTLGVLAVVLLLGTVCLHLLPVSQASAAPTTNSTLNDLVFQGSIGGFWLFDKKTGNIWVYEMEKGKVMNTEYVGTLVMPGQEDCKAVAPCIRRKSL
jgi:hypothetical protein